MATTLPPQPRTLNSIAGRVMVLESGLGIPDLVVVIQTGASAPAAGRPGDAGSPPERIGSVVTGADGSFALSYDDSEFRTSANGTRPDLMLMVLAPEDAGTGASVRVLYQSAASRHGAGRREAYLVRLATSQLEQAGVPIPRAEDEDADKRVETYRNVQRSKLRLQRGMAEVHKEVLDPDVEEKRAFRSRILSSVLPNVGSQDSGVVVRDDESILVRNADMIEDGIDRSNHVMGPESAGVPVNLYLTPEDKAALQPHFDQAVGGIAEIPESLIRPILFRTSSSENIGTLLVKQNPFVKYCREQTFDETCAIDHLGTASHDHDTPGDHDQPEPTADAMSTDDIPAYIDRLVSGMPAPDSVLKPGTVPARPTKADVEKSVTEFSLRKGPADVPAYYEFHSLQIAFAHVWKQLFDEDIVTGGYRLHQALKTKTGLSALHQSTVNIAELRNLVLTASAGELAEPPVEVAAHFEITREEWNELSAPFRNQLSVLAQRIETLLYRRPPQVSIRDDIVVRDHRPGAGGVAPNELSLTDAKLKQHLIEQGERLIDSVRHDDYYTMHKTLRDLQERMSGAYEYTVFAADKDHCSVNFGILNTFQQEWNPLNYQVGQLCRTIPMAPKEERRYSTKVVRRMKRAEREDRKTNRSSTTERAETSRVEADIVARAIHKTNFNLTTEGTYNIGISKGEAKTSFGIDAQKESQQSRKDFREAVLKAVQEYKEEHSLEVSTEGIDETEFSDSGTISNPNDELAVTYLFYELQRRYRVSEQLYRVVPVLLVAQPVPKPNEITEAWVIAHDWILDRFLLDDSFRPALQYLATKSVGDDFALRELRRNLRQQRNLVETLKIELSTVASEADNRYRALERSIRERIREEERERTDGWFSDVEDFFGGGGQDPEAAKARELAAKDAHQHAIERAEKMATAVRHEVDTLHKLTSDYNRTLRDHLDNETRVRRLLLHIRNHLIFYMQAIWSMEPPDQRFLRLQKVQAPHLELDDAADSGGRTYRVQVATSPDILAPFRPAGTEKHKATVRGRLKKPFRYKPLVEIADLDKPLGFKGNYMIFPMKQHNALTEFMAAPYIDSAFGAMDPDELSNVGLDDFSRFICCLHDHEPARFEQLKPILQEWLTQLLADPLRNGDEVVIPSGSLYIELLPSATGLLENFKLFHRELDVYKVQAEVRRSELENLRLADRLLNAEREDPDVERKIVVDGAAQLHFPTDA